MAREYICNACGAVERDVLTAKNPFLAGHHIMACPQCKQVGTLALTCAEKGCYRKATKRVPEYGGYVTALVCDEHGDPDETNQEYVEASPDLSPYQQGWQAGYAAALKHCRGYLHQEISRFSEYFEEIFLDLSRKNVNPFNGRRE